MCDIAWWVACMRDGGWTWCPRCYHRFVDGEDPDTIIALDWRGMALSMIDPVLLRQLVQLQQLYVLPRAPLPPPRGTPARSPQAAPLCQA
jgi:hypothetical protein